MLFQLSASVSQVAFGHLADRWRPRLLLMVGPIVSVVILEELRRRLERCVDMGKACGGDRRGTQPARDASDPFRVGHVDRCARCDRL